MELLLFIVTIIASFSTVAILVSTGVYAIAIDIGVFLYDLL